MPARPPVSQSPPASPATVSRPGAQRMGGIEVVPPVVVYSHEAGRIRGCNVLTENNSTALLRNWAFARSSRQLTGSIHILILRIALR